MSVMSELVMLRTETNARCANCGTTGTLAGIPVTTLVVDWRTELLCDSCVTRFDWSDWTFDPILNIYVHNSR